MATRRGFLQRSKHRLIFLTIILYLNPFASAQTPRHVVVDRGLENEGRVLYDEPQDEISRQEGVEEVAREGDILPGEFGDEGEEDTGVEVEGEEAVEEEDLAALTEEEAEAQQREERAKEEAQEAAKEAEASARDSQLPDVIDETQEEKSNYATLVEIDPDANRTKMYEGKYHHPYQQPNIVQDIYHTFRRFRKMKLIRHGKFWMGTNDPRSETGEYPLREVPVKSFYFDLYPVINAFYWAFRATKKFVRSEAEVKGWSWVTEHVVSNETRHSYSTEGPKGWLAVKKARWDRPEGPDSDLEDRWTHPVVHLSWHDAKKFCQFHGKRLPTEQEWEYAARAGLVAEEYPWGDRWERRRANTWQGKWPLGNSEADGYKATSPVDAYHPQNIIGLYDLIGNVWEWTHSRYYERLISRDLQGQMHVLKGGSFVDTVDGEINLPVRNGQRMGQSPDYTASNVGFRCARSAPEVDPKAPKPGQAKAKAEEEKQQKKKKPKVPRIYRKPKALKDEL